MTTAWGILARLQALLIVSLDNLFDLYAPIGTIVPFYDVLELLVSHLFHVRNGRVYLVWQFGRIHQQHSQLSNCSEISDQRLFDELPYDELKNCDCLLVENYFGVQFTSKQSRQVRAEPWNVHDDLILASPARESNSELVRKKKNW